MELPIYELRISQDVNEDVEVSYTALVDKPAIEKDFLAFNENKVEAKFAIKDEDKRIISGPLMIADKLIYRSNDKLGEHYVKFSAETIKDIAIKYAKKGYQSNVNLMHEPDLKVDGVVMFESFLVDKERGIMPMQGFEDVANGSWFGSFYVENNEVWQFIKEGKIKGFSVEGIFEYEPTKTSAEYLLAKLSKLLNLPI